jgi:hypothetical protein
MCGATSATLAAVLLICASAPQALAKGKSGRASIIATTDGGGAAKKPVVRDHRRFDEPRCRLSRQSYHCQHIPPKR